MQHLSSFKPKKVFVCVTLINWMDELWSPHCTGFNVSFLWNLSYWMSDSTHLRRKLQQLVHCLQDHDGVNGIYNYDDDN